MGSLVGRFKEAGLSVDVAARPVVRTLVGSGATDIVQMTIRKASRNEDGPRERFHIFRGHWANRVEVLGIDKELQQVVLFVHEPARTFQERVWKANETGRGGGTWALEARKAPAMKRHFLMGMDESHLFIAQLPRPATTVREAHMALRAGEVSSATARKAKIVRQGEWFFVAPSAGESEALEEALEKTRVAVHRKAPIGPVFYGSAQGGRFTLMRGHASVRQARGNPHVADEVVTLPGATAAEGRKVFARGAVRHVEHKTVVLEGWMRVVPNAELGASTSVAWVD